MVERELRVGFFSYDFYPFRGGQGRNFYEAFERLKSLDAGTKIFAFSPCQNSLAAHTSILSFVNRLPLAQLFFSFFLNFALAGLVRRHGLDVVVLNGGPGGILFFRKTTATLVYWVNHTYRQQSAYVAQQAWKRIFVPLERRCYRGAERLAAISSTTARELMDNYGVAAERITLIPVGINVGKFKPLTVEKLPFSLFFLGRLEPRKGIGFLLDALPLIAARIPEAILYVGGTGRLRPGLEAFVRSRGLEKHVKFLGYIPEDELVLWYNKCQVQIVPSVLEGLGITALEGLACGTPVVATQAPGITDIVIDGCSGSLVAYGDREGLCRRAVELLSDAELYLRYRENGLKRVKEVFAWERVLERYRSFFMDLRRT